MFVLSSKVVLLYYCVSGKETADHDLASEQPRLKVVTGVPFVVYCSSANKNFENTKDFFKISYNVKKLLDDISRVII